MCNAKKGHKVRLCPSAAGKAVRGVVVVLVSGEISLDLLPKYQLVAIAGVSVRRARN